LHLCKVQCGAEYRAPEEHLAQADVLEIGVVEPDADERRDAADEADAAKELGPKVELVTVEIKHG
jgi:hypothetical protein